jgi:hypothetical protein
VNTPKSVRGIGMLYITDETIQKRIINKAY